MSQQHVMIIDDDDEFRELLALIVEANGYRTSEAIDGVDALAKLEHAPLPQLIVLDLRMPRMNGIELIAALHKVSTTRSIPIIALSGDIAAAQDALRAGALAFLQKPVAAGALLEAIGTYAATTDAAEGPPVTAQR